MLSELKANPPQWALDAGLPAPFEDELFSDYVIRLGLDADELLVELTDQTAELAHYRLVTTLARAMPDVWRAYVDSRCRGNERTPPLPSVLLSRTRPGTPV